MQNVTSSSPLIFVFQGLRWPKYVKHSLRLAARTAQVPVVVLTNLEPLSGAPEVSWFKIADFYQRKDFDDFQRESNLPRAFRNGFWFHTVERFFILRDFMSSRGITHCFHGELDCVFLHLNELEIEIKTAGLAGFFFPRETSDRGLGSLVYMNNLESLSNLCEHFLKHACLGLPDASAGNEMHLLGLLPHDGKNGQFHALPTAEWFFRKDSDSWPVYSSGARSIVDGAALGRWVFGMDPANTGGRGTSNLIQNHRFLVPFHHELAALEFKFSRQSWKLHGRNKSEDEWFQIRVLHVHSKVHHKLTARYVSRVLARVNYSKRTVVVPPTAKYFLGVFRRVARQLFFLAQNKDLRADQWQRLRARVNTARKRP